MDRDSDAAGTPPAGSERARATVLVIDDHAAVREGLRSLIGEDDALEVIAEANEPEDALALAQRHLPDVIVVDHQLGGTSGIALLAPLRAAVPGAKLVMFTLDVGVREQALARGADVFVAKDAPMDEILAALRPAKVRAAPRQPEAALVPRLDRTREIRRGMFVIASVLALYAIGFLAVESVLGASTGALVVVPVVVVGAMLGPEAGLVGAALAVALTGLLWAATGHGAGEPVLAIGGQGVGIVVTLLLGLGSGAMRSLGLRFDPRRRRAEAVAEAARALAGLDRDEFVGVFLDAMLRVVPGDIVLLYAGDGETTYRTAVGDGAAAAHERMAALVRDTMRSASPRIVADLGETERPLPHLRSAALVPVCAAGQDVRGAIVVLHREPERFTPADLALMRPFAEHLWVMLRNTSSPLHRGRTASARRTTL